MKLLILCLLAALALGGSPSVRACQYCRLAASDPDMARLAAEMHAKSGGFPLDAAINQFQAVAPSATLTAPPPTTSVATSAADLPSSSLPLAAGHRVVAPTIAKAPQIRPAVAPIPALSSATGSPINRWADAGLLGLLGLAGVFAWFTRRVGG